MKRIVTGLMIVLAATLLSSVGCRRHREGSGEIKTGGEKWEREVFRLTNEFRQGKRLPPLTLNENLTTAARSHAYRMAEEEDLSHTLGGLPSVRIVRFGYTNWSWCAENIAWGQRSPDEAMESWIGSPGHRANLLSGHAVDIGVGVMYSRSGEPFWCQLFAAKRR